MKIFKTITLAVLVMFATAGFTQAQDNIPELPTDTSDMRIWLGGGIVSGAEDDFKAAKSSFAVAGGVYFPSNIIPVTGFHSFVGVVYNRAESVAGDAFEVRTWDVQFRFLYYLKFSNSGYGAFLLFGPDYKHIQNSSPLAFTGSLVQASTGAGGYIGLGESKETRLSVVVERDFMGGLGAREWRFLGGVSRGFDPKLF